MNGLERTRGSIVDPAGTIAAPTWGGTQSTMDSPFRTPSCITHSNHTNRGRGSWPAGLQLNVCFCYLTVSKYDLFSIKPISRKKFT
jgi:hypothetical protein